MTLKSTVKVTFTHTEVWKKYQNCFKFQRKWELLQQACHPGGAKLKVCVTFPQPQHWIHQGCVLSPLQCSLYTYNCIATSNTMSFITFADNTVVKGLITDNVETAYLEEIRNLEN